MIDFVSAKVSERKLRLLACAGCRHIANLFNNQILFDALELIEKYADRSASNCELARTEKAVWDFRDENCAKQIMAPIGAALGHAAYPSIARSVGDCLVCCANAKADEVKQEVYSGRLPDNYDSLIRQRELGIFAKFVRDIFGNPFRPLICKPEWQTTAVQELAQAIYNQREFESLPALADELENAGCKTRSMLDHCRRPGRHVRGCWVLDTILGKM